MVVLKVDGKDYPMRMDMYAMEQIEEEYGSMKDMFDKLQKGSVKIVKSLFKILANSALSYQGKEETVTGEELKRLRVSAINGVGVAVRAAIEEGMKSETTGGSEADDQVFDVYLAELESKN